MSERWPGGIVRATPVTPTGPLQNGTAPGVWTLDQANYWIKQGLWPTAGNFLAVEDVFSTWLYTGTTPTPLTINNGINLSGQGGMVWIKSRSTTYGNFINDTARGATNNLLTNTTDAQFTNAQDLTGFTSSGFSLGTNNRVNDSAATFASWTFRKAANFFDVVTGTADGSGGFSFSHNLGSTPGMVILKNTNSGAGDWLVFHTSTGTSKILYLNQTSAAANTGSPWINVSSTSVSSNGSGWFVGGATYVAYLYAHDTSSTGIIQCGSYAGTNAAGNTVTLGWEPQWVLIKNTTNAQFWGIYDNMRGMPVGSNDALLVPNSSGAEQSYEAIQPTATGFQLMNGNQDTNASGNTYIYIAIRRGPMRTPTLGTTVFSPAASSAAAGTAITTNFPVDLNVFFYRPGTDSGNTTFEDRLRGMSGNSTDTAGGKLLRTSSTAAETTTTVVGYEFWNTNWKIGSYYGGYSNVFYSFRRAPSFFDEVCYPGVNATLTLNHNLGVAPELIIVKNRTSAGTAWPAWASPFSGTNDSLYLNTTAAKSATGLFTTTPPTSTTFTVGNDSWINASGSNYVAYLFASCPGVSKVGSYTGTGALQTINCGFTTGARFVLIKRTDSTGDWFVWDSARGISSGNDPYLLLNSTAAEVTGTNYVDTDTTGFQVTAAAPAGINANGGSYIFLAVA